MDPVLARCLGQKDGDVVEYTITGERRGAVGESGTVKCEAGIQAVCVLRSVMDR